MVERKRGSGVELVAGIVLPGIGLLALPVVYVLSAGPALWVCVNARWPSQWWNVAYWPLTYARDVVPGFHPWFQWYLDLWTV